MLIYQIKNELNNKVYVGQTKYDLQSRWSFHLDCKARLRKGKNYPLYEDFDLYGLDNFEMTVLKDDLSNQDELDYWERYYISKLNSRYPNGYNLTDGGLGTLGFRHTDEEKQKISKAVCKARDEGRIYTKERSQKISEANKGKKFSEEHKRKLSEIAKTRTGEKNPFYGKKHKPEVLAHISELNSKPCYQYNKVTGEYMQEFKNVTYAAKYIKSLSITKATEKSIAHGIQMCCENRYGSSYGYLWKYSKV